MFISLHFYCSLCSIWPPCACVIIIRRFDHWLMAPSIETETLTSHCVSYRTFRVNECPPCGLLVRWTVQTWHFTSQLKTFPPKIFHNCTDLRFHCMYQEKRVCICPQLRPLWSRRTQHICCFLQSRPSLHAVVDACQTSANEDCRYLHSFITIAHSYCTQH